MNSILVLSGGTPNEREVSLRSGQAVTRALQTRSYRVTTYDPRDGMDNFGTPDVVFPALHGIGGEDGVVQTALEKQGIAYVGSGAVASALCFDKWAYKQHILAAGLPTAEAVLVTKDTIWQSPFTQGSFVLKPIKGGSSIDTFVVRDTASVNKAKLEEVLGRYKEMLLERLIEGIELTAGVLDDKALPIVEIIPPYEGEFDYANKYNGMTQELCPPQHLDKAIQTRAQELALQAHRLFGCRDLSRTDMIATPDGRLVILETNTMPGMTDQSLYPKAAAAAGITMPDLIDRLVSMAAARAKLRS